MVSCTERSAKENEGNYEREESFFSVKICSATKRMGGRAVAMMKCVCVLIAAGRYVWPDETICGANRFCATAIAFKFSRM